MKNPTPFLPGIHFSFLRRGGKKPGDRYLDEQRRLARRSLSQLRKHFAEFIPETCLQQNATKAFSRCRLFTKENIFWAFFSQVLDADGGCSEVVRRLQAQASANGLERPSSSTAAYCKARSKLDNACLQEILTHTGEQLVSQPSAQALGGRRVVVVDGTGISMPDTPANQSVWPQPRGQAPGCGFPQARILACFDLASGGLISHAVGNKHNHELPLLRRQWDQLDRGDIVLGDKGFCSYYDMAGLSARKIDSVTSLARRRPVSPVDAVHVLGPDDLLIRWSRPKWKKFLPYTREYYDALPATLLLRQIKVTINQPGFRATSFHIVTTLTDPIRYRAHELADLYYQRWDVELFFRDIKTTLNMDVVRCQSPDRVRNEILMHFIVYNCIRLLMLHAGRRRNAPVRRISFKASTQALRQWQPHFNQPHLTLVDQRRLMHDLLEAIAGCPLSHRPGRSEPRCVKRRPKPFQLLTAPRDQMKVSAHRGQIRSKGA